jgi:hypothetical protein
MSFLTAGHVALQVCNENDWSGGGMRWSRGPATTWANVCRSGAFALLAASMFLALCGCAFDVSYVRRMPTEFQAAAPGGPGWTLLQGQSILLGSGFPTTLRRGTRWQLAGHIPQGDVYRTSDQVVTVEASNIYEAMAVMRGDKLTGFYLPVDHAFVAATDPVTLPIERGTQQ